eukprot:7663925-Heterocapsa_arctica.AAC.1
MVTARMPEDHSKTFRNLQSPFAAAARLDGADALEELAHEAGAALARPRSSSSSSSCSSSRSSSS